MTKPTRYIYLQDLQESKINRYLLSTGFLNNLTALLDLRLGTNNLLNLPNNSFDNCSNLQYVDVHNNKFYHIPCALKKMEPLTILNLRHNRIMYIDNSAPYYDLAYLQDKVNSTSPTGFYSCAMVKNFVPMFSHTKVFDRLKDQQYSYVCNASYRKMPDKTEIDNRNVVIISITVGMVYLVASTLVIFRYVFYWDMRWQRMKEDGDEEFEYDAFICYSSKDYKFVRYQLMENIEEKTTSQDDMAPIPSPNESQDQEYFRLAVDFRLFLPGGFVPDNIIDYMNRSRKTIILVSQNFLDGNWTMWEYQIAQSRAVERRDKLIVVLLENVPMRKMPRGLNKLIKDREHMEWTDDPIGQEVFWRKMRKALQKPISYSGSAVSEHPESPRRDTEYQVYP